MNPLWNTPITEFTEIHLPWLLILVLIQNLPVHKLINVILIPLNISIRAPHVVVRLLKLLELLHLRARNQPHCIRRQSLHLEISLVLKD